MENENEGLEPDDWPSTQKEEKEHDIYPVPYLPLTDHRALSISQGHIPARNTTVHCQCDLYTFRMRYVSKYTFI